MSLTNTEAAMAWGPPKEHPHLCYKTWDSGMNFILPHQCRLLKGHIGQCECICGANPGDETDNRRSKG